MFEDNALNLEHAIAASCHQLACRVVGDRRVIVRYQREVLTIQIQRRSKRRWITDDDGGDVRYLAGVTRVATGRYLDISDDLSDIVQMRVWLPLRYQTLLVPECEDWQSIECGGM
jgi:hypothetical protein